MLSMLIRHKTLVHTSGRYTLHPNLKPRRKGRARSFTEKTFLFSVKLRALCVLCVSRFGFYAGANLRYGLLAGVDALYHMERS